MSDNDAWERTATAQVDALHAQIADLIAERDDYRSRLMASNRDYIDVTTKLDRQVDDLTQRLARVTDQLEKAAALCVSLEGDARAVAGRAANVTTYIASLTQAAAVTGLAIDAWERLRVNGGDGDDPHTLPEHLRMTASARGFVSLPPVPSIDGGDVVVYESSNAEGPHLRLRVKCPVDLCEPDGPWKEAGAHLPLEDAAHLRDQLTFLIDNHYQK